MTILQDALIASHRKNIERYTRLLGTKLAAHERKYIHKRLTQERMELDRLRMRALREDRAPPTINTSAADPIPLS
jgi:hypothetical protein